MLLLLGLLGCTPPSPSATDAAEPPPPDDAPRVAPAPPKPYDLARASLQARRLVLAATPPSAARRDAARAAVLDFFDRATLPAWTGTPWSFYGQTDTPGEGTIACGYFVTTALSHAGLRLDHLALAKLRSTWIVTTLAGEDVLTLRDVPAAQALRRARAAFGDGLWVVGLDNHVGFLRSADGEVRFCHADYTGPGVRCEDPLTSTAFASSIYVIGPAWPDARVDDWLAGRAVATVAR